MSDNSVSLLQTRGHGGLKSYLRNMMDLYMRWHDMKETEMEKRTEYTNTDLGEYKMRILYNT